MQLIQLYVQKSTSTTFPLRSERFIGLVFMYPVTLSNSGAFLNCDLSIENCDLSIENCDLSIENCAFLIVVESLLPSCATCVAGMKFDFPHSSDAALLSSGLLKYTAKPTINDTTAIAIANALRLSLFIC